MGLLHKAGSFDAGAAALATAANEEEEDANEAANEARELLQSAAEAVDRSNRGVEPDLVLRALLSPDQMAAAARRRSVVVDETPSPGTPGHVDGGDGSVREGGSTADSSGREGGAADGSVRGGVEGHRSGRASMRRVQSAIARVPSIARLPSKPVDVDEAASIWGAEEQAQMHFGSGRRWDKIAAAADAAAAAAAAADAADGVQGTPAAPEPPLIDTDSHPLEPAGGGLISALKGGRTGSQQACGEEAPDGSTGKRNRPGVAIASVGNRRSVTARSLSLDAPSVDDAKARRGTAGESGGPANNCD